MCSFPELYNDPNSLPNTKKHPRLANISEQLGATSVKKLTYLCGPIAYIDISLAYKHTSYLKGELIARNLIFKYMKYMPLQTSAKCKV